MHIPGYTSTLVDVCTWVFCNFFSRVPCLPFPIFSSDLLPKLSPKWVNFLVLITRFTTYLAGSWRFWVWRVLELGFQTSLLLPCFLLPLSHRFPLSLIPDVEWEEGRVRLREMWGRCTTYFLEWRGENAFLSSFCFFLPFSFSSPSVPSIFPSCLSFLYSPQLSCPRAEEGNKWVGGVCM